MMESRVNQVFQWILGILFIGFGLLYLLSAPLSIDITWWIFGGIIAIAALVRLVLVSLPGSGPFFTDSPALEIITAVCEALFGVFFVLNAVLYIDFIYPLLAALLAVMAIVRLVQSSRVKKMRQNGWGSYLFMGILFLGAAAGLVLFSYVFTIDLRTELLGTAAFVYGFFLIFSASFKKGLADIASDAEPGTQGGEELEEYSEDRTKRKLSEN